MNDILYPFADVEYVNYEQQKSMRIYNLETACNCAGAGHRQYLYLPNSYVFYNYYEWVFLHLCVWCFYIDPLWKGMAKSHLESSNEVPAKFDQQNQPGFCYAI